MRVRRTARLWLVAATVLACAVTTGIGWGYWTVGSQPGGGGAAAAATVNAGETPTGSVAGRAVTLIWSASVLTSGATVSGYQIRRYDASGAPEYAVLSACSGTITSTTCTESEVPNGSWSYTITPIFATSWRGAESAPSSPVVVNVPIDVTPPVNALSLSAVTGGAYLAGGTLYYLGTLAGSLKLTNALQDAGTGPASSQTHSLVGSASGWSHSPSTVAVPVGGPYESGGFDWTAGTASAPTEVVTGRDGAGNATDTTLTFLNDSTPPTNGTVAYPDGYQTELSVSVAFTTGTDGGSGIATRQLQRDVATLAGDVCGTYAGFSDLGPDTPTSPRVDDQVSAGHCYRYRYVVRDRVGNVSVATSASVVRVEAPGDVPALGTAAAFSVLAGTSVVSTGATSLSGDLGVSPSTAITGFPPGTVAGAIHAGDLSAAAALAALVVAYNAADALVPSSEFAGDLNGVTFRAGVHHTAAAMALTGTLTLDAQGHPNAVFVIQVDAALNTAAASHVVLVNGARASNVFWQSLGAAGTGADSTFAGTILAAGAITLGAGTQLIGRALSYGTVTMAANTVRFTDALPPTIAIDGGAAAVTKDPTPTITGTTNAAAATTIRVTVAGQLLTTPAQANGTWNVTADAMLAGVYPLVASVRDAAGNAGTATQSLAVEVNPDPVLLQTAAAYSVLAGTSVVSTGVTILGGNLGVSPGTGISGDPPIVVAGTVHAGDAAAAQAQADLVLAYNDANARVVHTEFAGDQNGRTFHAGVHHSATAFALTGTLTLDAEGIPNAVFIFQVDAALNTAASSQVVLVNGAQAKNVYWQVEGAVGTGALASFAGNILAAGAVTLGAGSTLVGAALSLGTITLADNVITAP